LGRDVGDCRRGLLCFGLFFLCVLVGENFGSVLLCWLALFHEFIVGCLFVCNFAHLLSYLPVLMVNHGAFTRFSLVLFL